MKTTTPAPPLEKVIAYKGFNKDWKCRDFQYKVGETFEHKGSVEACKSGFHACQYPLDVFQYYPPTGSRFAVVEQSGEMSRHHEDSKIASKSISIKAEISIAGLVQAAIEYTTSRCAPVDPDSPASATGDYGAASATGKASVAVATGWEGRAQAAEGCAIVLVFRDDDGNIVHIRASKVGENGIKAGAWYTLDGNGQIVEFKEQE
ncbi:MAG: hypothetical protein KGI71_04000 [Patescibacteria group bacterium]|nr:hypothetical protein [Patescibacteria group bacterium]